MARTKMFRTDLNQVSNALCEVSLLEELRYLDKLCMLGPEHLDLEVAVGKAVERLERATRALPVQIAGGSTWPGLRRMILGDLESFLVAYDGCDFKVACDRLRSLRDSVAVGRSYLAMNEHAESTKPCEERSEWSFDELARNLRSNGIILEGDTL